LEVVQVAAYLHDLGVSKKIAGTDFSSKENDHHIVGAEEARKVLTKLNYPGDFVEKVVNCVLSHRGRKGPEPVTLEQKIIANADAMAHFDTFLDLFNFFATKTTSSFEEAVEEIYKKMKRDWEIKLTLPEAKEIVKPKYEAIMLILESMKSYF
jgi:HD superfamily phosphodiesterase